MSIKYNNQLFNPSQLDPLNIDRLALSHIQIKTRVLELGCATGFMGEYLRKKNGCFVMGVEQRKDEGYIAEKKLDGVILADIENPETIDIIQKKSKQQFDHILATSIIEHLKDPETTLQRLHCLLKKDGTLIITTPNIAHWSMRLSLLFGTFDYTEYGILDNTHLHLYTIKTFRHLIEDCGYTIQTTGIDPVGGGYPKISFYLSHLFPTFFAYQLLIVAKKNG